MKKVFVDTKAGNDLSATVDGIKYKFTPITCNCNCGYAQILIHDITNRETYISNGYIEINNHIIESKWGMEFNTNRDNYMYNDNLTIDITSYY